MIIKSFVMGALPLALFIYLMMYHPYVIIVIAIAGSFAIVSWMIGTTYREEFGDLRDKEEY